MKEPKIRLKGFSGEWEETAIGNLFTFKNGLNKGKEYFGHGTPIVNYTDVYKNRLLSSSLIKGKVELDFDEINRYRVQKGDVFFTRTSETPEEVGFTSVLVEDIKDCSFSGFVLRARPITEELVPEFCGECFSIDSVRNAIKSTCTYTTRALTNGTVLSKINLCFPTKEEQQAIASYFQHLDSLIQSTTKKIESLKQVKAASLQSMFPQEGETVPRVRFKGFEGEWENVAIKDIASFSKGHGYSKSDLRDCGTPIILYGRMYTKYEVRIKHVDTFVQALPNSIYSVGDEVIMPASGETPEDISCASAICEKGIIIGGDLNVMHFDINRHNTVFIALSLSIGKAKRDLSNMAQGKSVVHLHNSDIEKATIYIPTYDEQQAIASYFTNLDTQISLQTKRLDKLKQIKSACLDNMFV